MTEWGILDEGAHKTEVLYIHTYMPTSHSALLTYN